MGLNAKKVAGSGSSGSAPLLDAANYPARLVQVIDLGLQPLPDFKGKAKKPANQIWCTYELPTEFMKKEDGSDDLDAPRWISERINLFSMSAENALSTKRMKGLDPKDEFDGDWSRALDTPCTLTVVQKTSNGKTYANIGAVSAPMKGLEVGEIVNQEKIKFFDLEDPDLETFNGLPEFLQDIITSNLEYKGSKLEKLLTEAPDGDSDDGDDEPPF